METKQKVYLKVIFVDEKLWKDNKDIIVTYSI